METKLDPMKRKIKHRREDQDLLVEMGEHSIKKWLSIEGGTLSNAFY